MTKHLRTLGLVFVAVLALTAFAASAAQAKFSYTAGEAPADLTGSIPAGSEDVFSTEGGTVKCTSISFTGTSTLTTASEQKIEPHYNNCTAFGLTAHVNATPCYYTFTTPTAGAAGERTGEPPHVICPNNGSITITPTLFGGSVCTTTIKENTPGGGHIIYTNSGTATAMDILVHTTVEKIPYTSSGGACGTAGAHTDGKYTGTETLIAYKHGKPHEPANQISLTVS